MAPTGGSVKGRHRYRRGPATAEPVCVTSSISDQCVFAVRIALLVVRLQQSRIHINWCVPAIMGSFGGALQHLRRPDVGSGSASTSGRPAQPMTPRHQVSGGKQHAAGCSRVTDRACEALRKRCALAGRDRRLIAQASDSSAASMADISDESASTLQANRLLERPSPFPSLHSNQHSKHVAPLLDCTLQGVRTAPGSAKASS